MHSSRFFGLAFGLAAALAVPAFAQSTSSPMPMSSGGQMTMQNMQHMQRMQSMPQVDRDMMHAMMGSNHRVMQAQMTGKIDHDFLVMMLMHQQAALRLAEYEQQHGSDAATKALATSAATAAQSQIAQLQAALK